MLSLNTSLRQQDLVPIQVQATHQQELFKIQDSVIGPTPNSEAPPNIARLSAWPLL